MKISFPSNSAFLAQDDFNIQGEDLKIDGVSLETMNDGEQKHVLYFQNKDKGLVLNQTNGNILISLFGDDTDAWRDQFVNVYRDPTVSFGGKVVGGLRIRMQLQQRPQPTEQHQPTESPQGAGDQQQSQEFNDDIPF